jgi:hypothetical protein
MYICENHLSTQKIGVSVIDALRISSVPNGASTVLRKARTKQMRRW